MASGNKLLASKSKITRFNVDIHVLSGWFGDHKKLRTEKADGAGRHGDDTNRAVPIPSIFCLLRQAEQT